MAVVFGSVEQNYSFISLLLLLPLSLLPNVFASVPDIFENERPTPQERFSANKTKISDSRAKTTYNIALTLRIDISHTSDVRVCISMANKSIPASNEHGAYTVIVFARR